MNYQSWTGHKDPKLGYGSMLDGFVKAAPKGVEFADDASVSVHMQVPDAVKGWWVGQHRVLFTMWETDTMPNRFKPWLGLFDQILVPCADNAVLFADWHDDVKVVPLGVDLQFWRKSPERSGGPFRFHAGGSLWRRKGLDVVVEAFKRLRLPNSELHIKAAPHAFDTPDRGSAPNVVLHRDWMPKTVQRDWYDLADCFVAPARGEGFGLMPLQAIAMGIPTIVSLSSGQKEFAHLAGWQIRCGKSQAETVGLWDEPNVEELMEAMRDAYERRLPRSRPAGVAEFSWANSAKRLVAAVPKGTRLGSSEWVLPEVNVRVKARRYINAIIANKEYKFRQGDVASIPEGVYQVLSDSGAVEMEPAS